MGGERPEPVGEKESRERTTVAITMPTEANAMTRRKLELATELSFESKTRQRSCPFE